MKRETLPSSLLSPWARLNGVVTNSIRLDHQGDNRGYRLVAERDMSDSEVAANPLMTVPKDLVLSAEAMRGDSRFDRHLRELLDAAPQLAEILYRDGSISSYNIWRADKLLRLPEEPFCSTYWCS